MGNSEAIASSIYLEDMANGLLSVAITVNSDERVAPLKLNINWWFRTSLSHIQIYIWQK